MATGTQLKASASLTWTPPGGSETTILLRVPLGVVKEFRPSILRARFDWWAKDYRNRRTVTIGPGVREIVWTLRLDDEPVQLLRMLRDGLEHDVTITYQYEIGGPTFPFRIVEIIGAGKDEVPILPDRHRWGGGDWEVPFRARRTDGGTFDALLQS